MQRTRAIRPVQILEWDCRREHPFSVTAHFPLIYFPRLPDMQMLTENEELKHKIEEVIRAKYAGLTDVTSLVISLIFEIILNDPQTTQKWLP